MRRLAYSTERGAGAEKFGFPLREGARTVAVAHLALLRGVAPRYRVNAQAEQRVRGVPLDEGGHVVMLDLLRGRAEHRVAGG